MSISFANLQSLRINFSGFVAQVMHDLTLAVETHDSASHRPGMFHGSGSNNFFHLRDIGSVHAERRQTESQEKKSVQGFTRHFTTHAHVDGAHPLADDVADESEDRGM